MKLGIHTIAWGESREFSAILEDVRAAGFAGIELFQHPDHLELAGPGNWAERLDRSLINEARGRAPISLVGVCFGAFEERRRFVNDLAKAREKAKKDSAEAKKDSAEAKDSAEVDASAALLDDPLPYLYTDEWGDEEKAAVEEGLRVAVHPHMFQQIQTMQEVDEILDKHSSCLFLPDAAHLYIAGNDPAESIYKVLKSTEHREKKFCRIAAVHLKDWNANAGRSYQFYARGLCALGKGEVPLERVIEKLVIGRYDGWLIVEQDRARNPRQTAQEEMDWLKAKLPSRK